MFVDMLCHVWAMKLPPGEHILTTLGHVTGRRYGASAERRSIRQLEANLAEAVALLRHVLMTTDDEEEAREFLARIDAASGKK